MNKKLITIGISSNLCLLSLLTPFTVQADQVYAQVLSAHPVYTQVQIPHPTQYCHQEQVRDNSSSLGGTIIGGLAGGLLGHTVGKGSGNVAATAGGAVVGATVGNEIASNNNGVRTVERCVTQNDFTYENRITSYDVEYTYGGLVYHTNMPYDPGNQIRIEASVHPLY